jgi:hypothetical protein
VLTIKRLGLLVACGVAVAAWWCAACDAGCGPAALPTPPGSEGAPPGCVNDPLAVTAPDRFRTADEVLDALAGLRKQQNELQAKQDALARQVSELKALLRKKLDQIEKRMKELNAGDDTPAQPVTPCTSY